MDGRLATMIRRYKRDDCRLLSHFCLRKPSERKTRILIQTKMDFGSKNMILFGFVLFLSAIGWSAAFQCYECNSVTSSACNDPFDSSSSDVTSFISTLTSCTACLKGKVGDLVTRSCSTTTSASTCESQSDVTACSCTSNLCNAGSGLQLKLTAVAFISSFPLIIYRFAL